MAVLVTPLQRRTAATAPRPRHRIEALDGLRLVAALMVVGYHFIAYDRGAVPPWGSAADRVFPWLYLPASYGWLGVQLFFVISGFVICLSAWDRTPGEFLRSRVIRLYPAYWVAALLTFAVLSLWPLVREPVGARALLVNLTMLQVPMGARSVDAVYWTLWVEARFYLLFALLVWRGLSVRTATLFGYGWLVAAALAGQMGVPALNVLIMPEHAPYFVAGIALYLVHRCGGHAALWALAGAAFLMAQHQVTEQLRHVARDVLGRPLPVLPALIVVAAIFAVMAIAATGRLSRVRGRWLTVAGALTYPLYLLHEYIGWTLIAALHPFLPRYAVLATVVAVVTVAAWLLHRYAERPAARLLRRHLTRPLPR
ncbi:acyltransferase family protein [Couchioplanes caeruleus]|uniref:Acyltransferase n=2 Tax=Couchioplanes caeruleus TaxID=56438 RepID=A0A1K0GJR7_9ACTN|nr:acyltransferase [Couchioplanes caeruleus]OJF11228.1 acyltransferase [Couchioplanes caeruleus subsp. caeruleus]OJF16046.1 acyltransferase [Couchioplanes caeruleus subsp. caeruleus]ROP27820.1 peptidoglycan/LPS O-acetylase OafA/YrhL [Couchioplanes caeruleus]